MLKNFKNRVHSVIDNVTGKVVGVVGGLALTTGSVFAAVPVEVTTALTDAKTDGISVAGLVLVAVIAMYAFKLMRRGI